MHFRCTCLTTNIMSTVLHPWSEATLRLWETSFGDRNQSVQKNSGKDLSRYGKKWDAPVVSAVGVTPLVLGVDKCQGNKLRYPLDSVIKLLNIWGQMFKANYPGVLKHVSVWEPQECYFDSKGRARRKSIPTLYSEHLLTLHLHLSRSQ